MNDPRATRGGEAGFSLVETVVAFAILSLVMTTAIQIVGAGTVRARKGQDRGIALAHAQSGLARLAMGEVALSSTSSGTHDDGFEWVISVVPMTDEKGASPHLAEITVTGPRIDGSGVVLRTVVIGRQPRGEP